MFAPYVLTNYCMNMQSLLYTMAFSNIPGMLQAIVYEGKKSVKMQIYFVPSGHTGMALSCISYVDFFKITLTVDDTIMKKPQTLLNFIE